MSDRIDSFRAGMPQEPLRASRMELMWLRLKRLTGIPTVNADMEGQLRYDRSAAATEGRLHLAKMGANDVMAWHHLLSYPYGTPTVTALAGAGTTATVSVSGNDTFGTVTIVPGGTGIAAGSVVELNFAVARPTTDYRVLVTESSASAGALTTPFRRAARATDKVTFGNTTALTSGSTYTFDYLILG